MRTYKIVFDDYSVQEILCRKIRSHAKENKRGFREVIRKPIKWEGN